MRAWVLAVGCALQFAAPAGTAARASPAVGALLSSGAATSRKTNASRANCTAAGAAARAKAARLNGTAARTAAAHTAATCAVGTLNASHQVRANATTAGALKPSCAAACDSCFATHLMECYATCYEGLQAYCRKVCTTSTMCTPRWSATPGTSDGLAKKFCDGMVDVDGCPTQNYDR